MAGILSPTTTQGAKSRSRLRMRPSAIPMRQPRVIAITKPAKARTSVLAKSSTRCPSLASSPTRCMTAHGEGRKRELTRSEAICQIRTSSGRERSSRLRPDQSIWRRVLASAFTCAEPEPGSSPAPGSWADPDLCHGRDAGVGPDRVATISDTRPRRCRTQSPDRRRSTRCRHIAP